MSLSVEHPRDFSTEKWFLGGIGQVVIAEFDAISATVLLRRFRYRDTASARSQRWLQARLTTPSRVFLTALRAATKIATFRRRLRLGYGRRLQPVRARSSTVRPISASQKMAWKGFRAMSTILVKAVVPVSGELVLRWL